MMGTTSGTLVQGHVEDGWGKVADAFRANFEGNPGEAGAACCVYVGGRPVVDLWGGLADREANRPWDKDTISPSPPRPKALPRSAPTCWCSAASWIWTRRWSSTGRSSALAGKEHIPVRWLLSHQAGLPVSTDR